MLLSAFFRPFSCAGLPAAIVWITCAGSSHAGGVPDAYGDRFIVPAPRISLTPSIDSLTPFPQDLSGRRAGPALTTRMLADRAVHCVRPDSRAPDLVLAANDAGVIVVEPGPGLYFMTPDGLVDWLRSRAIPHRDRVVVRMPDLVWWPFESRWMPDDWFDLLSAAGFRRIRWQYRIGRSGRLTDFGDPGSFARCTASTPFHNRKPFISSSIDLGCLQASPGRTSPSLFPKLPADLSLDFPDFDQSPGEFLRPFFPNLDLTDVRIDATISGTFTARGDDLPADLLNTADLYLVLQRIQYAGKHRVVVRFLTAQSADIPPQLLDAWIDLLRAAGVRHVIIRSSDCLIGPPLRDWRDTDEFSAPVVIPQGPGLMA